MLIVHKRSDLNAIPRISGGEAHVSLQNPRLRSALQAEMNKAGYALEGTSRVKGEVTLFYTKE